MISVTNADMACVRDGVPLNQGSSKKLPLFLASDDDQEYVPGSTNPFDDDGLVRIYVTLYPEY